MRLDRCWEKYSHSLPDIQNRESSNPSTVSPIIGRWKHPITDLLPLRRTMTVTPLVKYFDVTQNWSPLMRSISAF